MYTACLVKEQDVSGGGEVSFSLGGQYAVADGVQVWCALFLWLLSVYT